MYLFRGIYNAKYLCEKLTGNSFTTQVFSNEESFIIFKTVNNFLY